MIELSEVWTPTQGDFDAFARVSGDDNAIHVDPDFCAQTTFGRTVSHGMLIYSKLWGMVRRYDPSLRQVSQQMMFPNPAFTGEELLLEITEHRPNILTMRVTRSADGAECLTGEAEVTC
ncbi:MaoC/PaaZ C-terminal domain-containing protein [Thalassobius sp. Cn5-15]|jgi:acyl dehydratase|uniref:MaoC family dehydratase n=1 Tax=Thalassobius sp. Cn5-15 TaxID=2917763 RepID=UPI001EF39578|nr:MaoC/PaaZ C-terminal domain-containing protein [Thalassobius sp. Cn5-15]MCG7493268.1 hydratase [Thalassobius sp. Cn5-15]